MCDVIGNLILKKNEFGFSDIVEFEYCVLWSSVKVIRLFFGYIPRTNQPRTDQDFFSPRLFFGYAHALPRLVVAYARQGSPRGLSTERRWATSGSEKYHLFWRTFWAAVRVPVRGLRGGSSLQTTPTKLHSRKKYAWSVRGFRCVKQKSKTLLSPFLCSFDSVNKRHNPVSYTD